jgi:nucleoside-diphosphate-sugar epimerase
MKILITGANGFVGSALAKRLLAKGIAVRLFDLPGHGLWPQWNKSNAECIEGDLRSYQTVREAVRGCTHVFHSAALLNSVAEWRVFADINVGGTENLCRAAVEEGNLRFVHLSTSDVFGLPRPGRSLLDESSPFHPWNEPYADTKIAATRRVKQYMSQDGLAATIVYPGWVYGEGDRQFLPAVMEMVRDGIAFTWHRRDPYEINLIHINDLCDSIEKILENDRSIGQDFLVLDTATGMTPARFFSVVAGQMNRKLRIIHVPYPVMFAVAAISQWLARKKLISKPLLSTTDVKAFGHSFRFSNEKARLTLGWEPKVDPQQGLVRAVQWQQQRTTQ